MTPFANLPLRCWAEIDLAALERNLKAIQAALPAGIRYIAVVKADAYGHGMQQTVARLMQAGVDMFAVANIAEAAAVREIGAGWPILVLGTTLPDETPYLFEYGAMPTVSTEEELASLEAEARRRDARLGVHMKIDTGMGRLGCWHESAHVLYEALKRAPLLELKGVYTHFAHADEDQEFTRLQRARFARVLNRLQLPESEAIMVHADNSAALASFSPASHYNAVRIGLLQFGVSPYPKSLFSGVRASAVFSFKTRVGIVKRLPKGMTVSYGQTRRLVRDSRVAVLCAGYGDGVPLPLSNRGEALVGGRRCPILGRVTMDQTIVDTTDMPFEPQRGDEACLIGSQGGETIGLEAFAAQADAIPWEVLCSVTKRVPRVYRTSMATG